MNLIKKFLERRAQKAQLRRFGLFAHTFASLQRLEKGGLLEWEPKMRRLFIAQPLAIVMLAQGYDRWRNFLNNVFLYHMYNLQNCQWQDHIINEQAKAVRQRKKEVAVLTKAETERIRRAVRDNMPVEAVELPPIKSFEFFIIADTATVPDTSAAGPVLGDSVAEDFRAFHSGYPESSPRAEITWVGEYDPDTGSIDMAEWASIKHVLNNGK